MKIQPLEDLLQGVLWQVAGLLGAVNSFLAVIPEEDTIRPASTETEGFVAMMEEETELVIRASTGRFASHVRVASCLEVEKVELIRQTLQRGEIQIVETSTVVPLRVSEMTLGAIYLDRPAVEERDIELLQIFANQAAVGIQNAQLYEMATLDPLTGVFVRRFFDKWLVRELRSAFRSQQPVALLMMGIDGMKRINDTAGHLAGDRALVAVGKALRQATRSNDVIGRYGGDEFAVILPQTGAEATALVGQRILETLQTKRVSGPGGELPLQGSLGLSVAEPHAFRPDDIPRPIPQTYFQAMAQTLVQRADEALYQAKRGRGKNRMYRGAAANWPPVATVGETPRLQDIPASEPIYFRQPIPIIR